MAKLTHRGFEWYIDHETTSQVRARLLRGEGSPELYEAYIGSVVHRVMVDDMDQKTADNLIANTPKPKDPDDARPTQD